VPFLPNQSQPVSTSTLGTTTSHCLHTLWDTGASESYISSDSLSHVPITPIAYPKPIDLRLFDGKPSSAGQISHYIDTCIRTLPTSTPLPIRLNVTTLCDANLVLGSTWMAKNGSIIDLRKSLVTLKPLVPVHSTKEVPRASSVKRNPCTYPNNVALGIRIPSPPPMFPTDDLPELITSAIVTDPDITPPPPNLSETDSIESIRAVLRSALSKILPRIGKDIYNQPQLSKDNYAELVSIEPQFYEPIDTTKDDKETQELLSQIPDYCHDFLDIFRQKLGTQTLPPLREYDMKIDLRPSAKLAAAKLYQLSDDQQKVLLETLEREMAAGRIRPSKASYGSPMFFVPKKDGRWRMVVDYRKINEETIPDAYPLPLISQITNDLSKAKFFTKLDLVGAYQLLRMALGQEPLTAFRTQYGMFKSLVV
jgi:hypothetical protein